MPSAWPFASAVCPLEVFWSYSGGNIMVLSLALCISGMSSRVDLVLKWSKYIIRSVGTFASAVYSLELFWS